MAGDLIEQAECYDFDDTTSFTIDGWTTDVDHYVRIYAAQRFVHPTSGSGYYLNTSGVGAAAMTINEDVVRVEGLQIKGGSGAGGHGINITATGVLHISIEKCWLNDCGEHGIVIAAGATNSIVKIGNCLVDAADRNGYYLNDAEVTVYCYHCGAVDCANVGGRSGFNRGAGTFVTKNCWAQNPNIALGGGSAHWLGTFDAASNYNVSGDATAPGANSQTSATITFVNSASDWHISGSDTVAKDAGTDLSADANYPISDDWEDTARSATPEIGPDEIAAAGGGTILPQMMEHHGG